MSPNFLHMTVAIWKSFTTPKFPDLKIYAGIEKKDDAEVHSFIDDHMHLARYTCMIWMTNFIKDRFYIKWHKIYFIMSKDVGHFL